MKLINDPSERKCIRKSKGKRRKEKKEESRREGKKRRVNK